MTPEQRKQCEALFKLQDGRQLVMRPKRWLLRLFCAHRLDHWIRNLYGDQINYFGGMRSEWQCTKCGGIRCRPELNREMEKREFKRLMAQ